MADVNQARLETIEFLSSPKSQAAKARSLMWFGLLVGVVIGGLLTGFRSGFIFAAAILAAVFGALDWFVIRPSSKPGQTLLTLSQTAIESPRFTTKEKSFVWADIRAVSIELAQGNQLLQLELKPTDERRNKRSFLTGINPTRPSFPLAALAPEDQERLLDAVNQRLVNASGDARGVNPVVNVLAQERKFQERLVALAPKTWVTFGIIGLNVAVWLLMLVFGSGVLLGSAEKLLAWGGNAASEVQQGQLWRLLTATFLHSGVLHLLMNMVGLLATGMTVERIYGHRLFLLVYLGSGIVGSAASLHSSAQKVVSVGASGAVFGVAGALLVAVFHHRKQLPKLFGKQTLGGIGFFIVYSLVQGLATTGIDNSAHLGGLMAGMVLAALLPERFDMPHFERHVQSRGALALVFIIVAATAIALTAPVARFDMSEAFKSSASLGRSMEKFSSSWKDVEQDAKDVKAGKMSEHESDERSRSVHAPRLRAVLDDLTLVRLHPDDPRSGLATNFTQFVRLLHESLAMESLAVDGKLVPSDSQRAKAIETELVQLSARMAVQREQLKATQKR